MKFFKHFPNSISKQHFYEKSAMLQILLLKASCCSKDAHENRTQRNKHISVMSRASMFLKYPSRFMLACAMNPWAKESAI
jgi:hypothetical protein